MAKLAKVKLLASGTDISMVEHKGKRYEVHTNTLQNCKTENTYQGFITYCFINPMYLTTVWS